MRTLGTLGVWAVALLSIAVAGLLAFVFVSIPLSMDPTDVITAGSEPWATALYAAVGFAAVLVVGAVGLRLWHTARLKPAALAVIAADAAIVAWACVWAYQEYF